MIRFTVLAALLLTFIGVTIQAEPCRETVVIDSVEYKVGERWCDKKIDSTELADQTRLVKIPEKYSFEDYRIYVDLDARDAFVTMAEAGRKDSVFLIVDSGYRSARYQEKIFIKRMAEGEKFAEIIRFVAPPGYSLHETGRTIDMVPSDASFSRTDAYRWLIENAGQFGFIESSPKDTTGLMPWEPWHWTFIPQEQ